jgi:hypothetical protein
MMEDGKRAKNAPRIENPPALRVSRLARRVDRGMFSPITQPLELLMARQLAGLIVLCALAPAASLAQTQKPAAAPESASPFRPLDLPTPTQYRTASGRPGRGYWQQRVDYRIAATLDTAKREVRGRERIRYTNNSPHELP